MSSQAAVGRETEIARLEAFVRDGGGGRALLLEGEPGIGKTTLWHEAVARAAGSGRRVLSARPARSEEALPYAALTDLLGPVAGHPALAALPAPQRTALDTALLRAEGRTDARAVGVAAVALLEAVAGEEPLLVALDDVQWLDPASRLVLGYVARRLPQGVKVLLARRPEPEPPLGLDRDDVLRLEVGPLSLGALHRLLGDRLGVSLPRPLLVRVATTAGGNPFYALELARALGDAPGRDARPSLPSTLLELVSDRIAALSPVGREAAQIAAASPHPTPAALPLEGLREAELAGVLARDGDRVVFSHPLLETAVYDWLTPTERTELHGRLAAAASTSDERAHHLALAATEPDEDVAAEIEAAAERASSRGAQDAAAGLAQAAARLTPPARAVERARRLGKAAAAVHAAGSPAEALALAEEAVAVAPAGPCRAEALVGLSTIAWAAAGALGPGECLEAALAEPGVDGHLLGVIHAKLGMYSEGDQRTAVDHLETALALLDDRDPGQLAYALLARLFFGAQTGLGADTAFLERALELEQRAGDEGERSSLVLIWHQCMDEVAAARARHEVEDAWYRDRGDEIWRAEKRAHRALVEFRAGEVELARSLVEQSCSELESIGVTGALGMPFWTRAHFDAHAGRFAEARAALVPLLETEHARGGNGWFETFILETLGFLALTEGDPVTAVTHFEELDRVLERLGVVVPLAVRADADQIEATLGTGDFDGARARLERFAERHTGLPRRWTGVALPRARALVAAASGDADAALAALRAAPADGEIPFEHARNLLLRGTLERRLKQKSAAAATLGDALALFQRLGAHPWAERTRAELARVGLRHGDRHSLTPTERRIATLATEGLTNREIAQTAFVSAKTVEANLARVYRKLGIRSRAQLAAALARDGEGNAEA